MDWHRQVKKMIEFKPNLIWISKHLIRSVNGLYAFLSSVDIFDKILLCTYVCILFWHFASNRIEYWEYGLWNLSSNNCTISKVKMVEWLFISRTVQRGCVPVVPASKTEPPETQLRLVIGKVNSQSDLLRSTNKRNI